MSRAAEPTLQRLAGRPAVRLVSRLDRNLARPAELRELVLGLHPPQELLLAADARSELLSLLPETQARELAEILGVGAQGSPHLALMSAKVRRGTEQARNLLAFFGLTELPLPERDTTDTQEVVTPGHSLFPHQRTAVKKVLSALEREPHRALLHMPTGAGKTRTAMHVIARTLNEASPLLVVWLAHSQELCEQAAQEFIEAWSSLGDRPVPLHRWWAEHSLDVDGVPEDGLVIAGLAKAYASGVQSAELLGRLAGAVGLVVIDEAHQAVAPTYSYVLDFLTSAGPTTPLLGLTATPGRTWADIDEDERLADFFGRVKIPLEIEGYDSPVDFLVAEGYLADTSFESLHYEPGFELSPRDYADLENELDIPSRILRVLAEDEQRNLAIVARVEALMREHERILVFAATVEHAELIATVLRVRGHRAESVTGATPGPQRAGAIARFRKEGGDSRVLTNFGVLTAGFDAPQTSAAVIARPTQSLVLFSQMVGRATRGWRAGGNKEAQVVTVVDTALPGFASIADSFHNWEDVWNPHK